MSININRLDEVVYVNTTEDGDVFVTKISNNEGNPAIQFQDEGANVGNPGVVNTIDFVGSNVSIAIVGGKLTVTISGSSGGGTWGSITGTITNQTDLIALLSNYLLISTAAATYQTVTVEVTGNITASLDTNYIVTANATFTDPAPAQSKGFTVLVRNGTATVGAVAYASAGTIIHRIYHSGAWSNYVYYVVDTFSSASTARTNLGVTATGADTTYAFRSNNLSDLVSAATARTNLGVTATGADTTYAFRANNLSDLASAATARTNLGATTVGGNVFTLTNPSAISYLQINANNTVTALTLAQLQSTLGFSKTLEFLSSNTAESTLVLTNQANAEQIINNGTTNARYARYIDLTPFSTIRIVSRVTVSSASANNPRLYLKYSTDNGSNYTLIGDGTSASDILSLSSASGVKKSGWITIPSGAKTDVLLQLYQNGGDGTADPALAWVYVEIK